MSVMAKVLIKKGHFVPHEVEIQRQKREIAESLRYARVIQKAVFPSKQLIEKTFPEHFILLLPKDILSGDFYWVYRKEKKVFFAVADCTGHGVPGSLMSVLGISFLNELLARSCNQSANRLLNQLREMVMKSLGQTGSDDISKDGMDIALCVWDEDTNLLEYSGANNSLYLVREGKMHIFRPDPMPVGIHAVEERSFTNHEINLQDGDIIYLFSDGYPDQFGGPQNKKFMYNRFRNLLLRVSGMSMNEQKETLRSEIISWMNDQVQIDDILVMGVKFSFSIKF
jgi:serine phosphatase RsbU (regulator of sigma subunit)